MRSCLQILGSRTLSFRHRHPVYCHGLTLVKTVLPYSTFDRPHTSVETFANAEVPSIAPAATGASVTHVPRGKRSATLKKTQKEKRARRPGDEGQEDGSQRVRVVSCNEMDWTQLTVTFPTATRVDQQVVYFVDETDPEVCSFLFPYGVCVFWGGHREVTLANVALMNENGIPPPKLKKVDFSTIRDDDFFYFGHHYPVDGTPASSSLDTATTTSATLGQSRPPLCVRDGPRFTLHDHGVRLKMALSHAFAHSMRLDILEQQFKRISFVTKDIAPKQRQTGQIPVDWAEVDIVSTMGALDAIRRELEIDGCIRNVHDLFWDEDELSDVLDATRDYLEIEERVDHLLDQIELVRSQLANLQTEIHALHATNEHHRAIRREWYIILLIFYEAVVVKVFDLGEVIAHLMGL